MQLSRNNLLCVLKICGEHYDIEGVLEDVNKTYWPANSSSCEAIKSSFLLLLFLSSHHRSVSVLNLKKTQPCEGLYYSCCQIADVAICRRCAAMLSGSDRIKIYFFALIT